MRKLIRADSLARVEGEGGIFVEIKDGAVTKVHLRIFEAPRFFEAFLVGRPHQDVIDFTARICGICPVAYQMSSVHAIERIFGVSISRQVRALRRLMYCGEWIESHALHVYFLQGPDFYGLESAFAGRGYLETAKRGMRFKKLGNALLTVLGGRPIHPVSVKVGGFFGTPVKKGLLSLIPALEDAYVESLTAIRWASALDFGDYAPDTEFVSLRGAEEYPMNEGRVVSTKGLNEPCEGFLARIQEYQVDYSTALHSGIRRDGEVNPYLVGPLARLNLNHDRLPSEIKSVMRESGIDPPLKNIRMAIVARTAEIAYSFHEAMRIIREYEEPERASQDFKSAAGSAVWGTEAPRGLLLHKYELDARGCVTTSTIIPPTSQNLAYMERDIRDFVSRRVGSPSDLLRKETQKIVRGYDPCISCSAHMVAVGSETSLEQEQPAISGTSDSCPG